MGRLANIQKWGNQVLLLSVNCKELLKVEDFK